VYVYVHCSFRTRRVTSRPTRRSHQGFSLIELAIAVAIASLIAALAIPGYSRFVDRGRIASAKADLQKIEMVIERFHTQNGRLPDSLVDIGRADVQDPWGNAYHYLLIEGMPNSVRGKARKDRNLVPINSDFDLYSMGKDGISKGPIVAPQSEDDVIRGLSGGFIGLAVDF
jgi:general secretion pathway protein G